MVCKGGSKTEAGRNRVVAHRPDDSDHRAKLLHPARRIPLCCRHTFSTLLKDVEGNKLDKMRIVGHSDEKTADHYTHSQLAELSKITDQLR